MPSAWRPARPGASRSSRAAFFQWRSHACSPKNLRDRDARAGLPCLGVRGGPARGPRGRPKDKPPAAWPGRPEAPPPLRPRGLAIEGKQDTMRQLITHLFGTKSGRVSRRRPRRTAIGSGFALEALEARDLKTVSVSLVGTTLNILG